MLLLGLEWTDQAVTDYEPQLLHKTSFKKRHVTVHSVRPTIISDLQLTVPGPTRQPKFYGQV